MRNTNITTTTRERMGSHGGVLVPAEVVSKPPDIQEKFNINSRKFLDFFLIEKSFQNIKNLNM